MKKITMLGEINMAGSSASARIMLNLVKCFLKLDYEVVVLASEEPQNFNNKNASFISLPKFTGNFFSKLKQYFNRGKVYKNYLEKYSKDSDYVLMYSCSCYKNILSIIKFCKKNNIKTISNVSELYSIKQFSGFFGKIEYLIFIFAFYFHFQKADLIFCHSTFLEEKFLQKNKKTFRYSTIVDHKKEKPNLNFWEKKIQLIYAGFPGKKDDLLKFIKVLGKEKYQNKIELKIAGADESYIKRLDKSIKISKNIKCLGRLSNKELLPLLKNSHYSILLRPNETYAKAGFPSKLGESYSLGVPMLANITSDIGMYLTKDTGIIIEENTEKGIEKALDYALTISKKDYLNFRKKCYNVSKEEFSIDTIAKEIEKFL